MLDSTRNQSNCPGLVDANFVSAYGQPAASTTKMLHFAIPLPRARMAREFSDHGAQGARFAPTAPHAWSVFLRIHCLGAFGFLTSFPTTETIASIRYKSAMPIGMITKAGTHFVVQGTNRINGA